jgi:hypothetical protein
MLQCEDGASTCAAGELQPASAIQSAALIRPRIDRLAVSRVGYGVRHIALILLALTATAHAEDDEDAYFASFPKVSVGAGIMGRDARIDGKPESGVTAELELAYGRGRWQYLVEGDLGASDLQATMMTHVTGRRERGAAGMRWLARQFIPFDPLAIELYLRGTAGLEHYHWIDDTQLSRPDLDLGFSFAIRAFKRPHLFVRFDVDMVFAAGDTGGTAGMVVGW